jgi:hypothetical protein
MKKAIALIAFLCSAAHGAPAQTVAQVLQVSPTVKSINLLSTGKLSVEKRDGQVLTMALSSENVQHLLFEASNLSDVQLTTTHHAVMCMMMPLINTEQILSIADKSGTLRVTLSAQSCAIPDFTSPSDTNEGQMARSLRNEMIALGNEIAE